MSSVELIMIGSWPTAEYNFSVVQALLTVDLLHELKIPDRRFSWIETTQHSDPICRSVTMTRAGSPSVSPSHLPRPCGFRWGALGLQAIEMRAQLSSLHRRIMLLSSMMMMSDYVVFFH